MFRELKDLIILMHYRGADKSLAPPTYRCILSDGENISFDANLYIYIYIYSTNISPIMIINRTYETQTMGTGSFPGVRCGRGVTLTPHPLLVPRSKTEESYTSTLRKDLRGL